MDWIRRRQPATSAAVVLVTGGILAPELQSAIGVLSHAHTVKTLRRGNARWPSCEIVCWACEHHPVTSRRPAVPGHDRHWVKARICREMERRRVNRD